MPDGNPDHCERCGRRFPQPVFVTDVRIPFGSMVVLIIKWMLATLVASLVLAVPLGILWLLFLGSS